MNSYPYHITGKLCLDLMALPFSQGHW